MYVKNSYFFFSKAILKEVAMYAPKQQKSFATLDLPEDDLCMWFYNLKRKTVGQTNCRLQLPCSFFKYIFQGTNRVGWSKQLVRRAGLQMSLAVLNIATCKRAACCTQLEFLELNRVGKKTLHTRYSLPQQLFIKTLENQSNLLKT